MTNRNEEHGQVGSGQGEDSTNYDITPPEQREQATPAQPATDPHDDSRD